MPVLAVPGPAAAAPPPVTVEVPQGWEVLPPGADLLHNPEPDRAPAPGSSALLLATGRVRGTGIDRDDDTLHSVLESLVVGGDA